MHFSNPIGLLALLALPIIVLIHFLQERSQKLRVSTLFLLDHSRPISARGARLERLRNSLPLWLQLLAALIVTWLWCEPRWTRQDSRQQIALVLDSSVSMSAFQADRLPAQLAPVLRSLSAAAASSEWFLLESDTRRPVLYRGSELSALLGALDTWRPTRGTHDPSDALNLARSLVKQSGMVLFVTDRKIRATSGVGLVGIGEPFTNVGFAGLRVSDDSPNTVSTWTALLRNYGPEPQSRDWWIEWPDLEGEQRTGERHQVHLAVGETLTLQGALPPGVDRALLHITGDRFVLDDSLPLHRSQPKTLLAAIRLTGEPEQKLFTQMLEALPQLNLQGDPTRADVIVNEIGEQVESHAIQIAAAEQGGRVPMLDPAPVLADAHPFTRDLDFASLVTPAPSNLTLQSGDQPLLWKGNQPLALLRRSETSDKRQVQRLLLAWNPVESSASRNPAMLIMLHRFLDDLRQRKRIFFAGNFETDQPLPIAANDETGLTLHRVGNPEPFARRSPEVPGFFEVKAGDERLLAAAAHFGDPREADFRVAESFDETAGLLKEAALRQSEADPYTPLWLLLLAGCLLGAWSRGG